MSITLSARLRCVADYVLPGSTVADVGTDHAYIPIWLLQNGVSEHAYATDIKPGPLKNAAADAEKYGVADRMTLLLCDGLSACPADAVDSVICAGMGGETIMGILGAAPWVKGKRLILQPQTKFPELREWLRENGFCIADASLVYDTGRIYLVWLVLAGEMEESGAVDRALIRKRDPLLRPYTEEQIKRLMKQIRGMSASRSADSVLLAHLKQELAELLQLREEIGTWQP